MSSNFLTASQDLQALSVRFQGIVALGEFLAKLGSMENLEAEVQARIDKVHADEAKARDMLRVTEEALATAATELDQKRASRDSTIRDAQDEYAHVIELAKGDGEKIIEQAKADAEAIAEHAAKVKAESVAIEADIAAKIEEHKQWEDKIASLKAHMTDFLKEPAKE